MGLPGLRAATSVPTAATDTMGTAVVSQSATAPPGPDWCNKPSIGTLARPIPSVTTPHTTAATAASRRAHKITPAWMTAPCLSILGCAQRYARTVPGTLPLSTQLPIWRIPPTRAAAPPGGRGGTTQHDQA